MQMIWLVSGMLLQGQVPGPPQSPWAWHYYWGGWGIFMMIISMVLFWGTDHWRGRIAGALSLHFIGDKALARCPRNLKTALCQG